MNPSMMLTFDSYLPDRHQSKGNHHRASRELTRRASRNERTWMCFAQLKGLTDIHWFDNRLQLLMGDVRERFRFPDVFPLVELSRALSVLFLLSDQPE